MFALRAALVLCESGANWQVQAQPSTRGPLAIQTEDAVLRRKTGYLMIEHRGSVNCSARLLRPLGADLRTFASAGKDAWWPYSPNGAVIRCRALFEDAVTGKFQITDVCHYHLGLTYQKLNDWPGLAQNREKLLASTRIAACQRRRAGS